MLRGAVGAQCRCWLPVEGVRGRNWGGCEERGRSWRCSYLKTSIFAFWNCIPTLSWINNIDYLWNFLLIVVFLFSDDTMSIVSNGSTSAAAPAATSLSNGHNGHMSTLPMMRPSTTESSRTNQGTLSVFGLIFNKCSDRSSESVIYHFSKKLWQTDGPCMHVIIIEYIILAACSYIKVNVHCSINLDCVSFDLTDYSMHFRTLKGLLADFFITLNKRSNWSIGSETLCIPYGPTDDRDG